MAREVGSGLVGEGCLTAVNDTTDPVQLAVGQCLLVEPCKCWGGAGSGSLGGRSGHVDG